MCTHPLLGFFGILRPRGHWGHGVDGRGPLSNIQSPVANPFGTFFKYIDRVINLLKQIVSIEIAVAIFPALNTLSPA